MTTLTTPIVPDTAVEPRTSPTLHPNTVQRVRATRLGFSLDWWSVIVALILGALIWANVLPAIGW